MTKLFENVPLFYVVNTDYQALQFHVSVSSISFLIKPAFIIFTFTDRNNGGADSN